MMSLLKERSSQLVLIGVLLLGAVGGLSLGWKLWKPRPPVQEVSAPGSTQSDGSIILPKEPDANAKPPHVVPHGAVVEHITHVVVRPDPVQPVQPPTVPGQPVQPGLPPVQPADVQVDLTLVRMPDGQHRVIASSPNGTIVGGIDIPVEAAKPQPKELHHAAGLRYTMSTDGSKGYGPAYSYDKGFLRIGVDAVYTRYQTIQKAEWVAGASLMIRF